ncbi:MAG: hypothetical protein NXI15_10475 [Gammaproteobacteria bacterium]|nr:hypothetical protein [Gammaproteobacteria bacterium]
MNVFLHIGYPKTGSTAIQSHIFANQGWLAKRGLYVVQAGYSAGLGHCFLLAAEQSRNAPLDDTQRRHFAATRQSLREELAACEAAGYRAALLSWEGFALLGEQDIRELSHALEGHAVQLLAYVRDQVSLYESLTLQRAKRFAIGPLLEHLGPGELPASLPPYLDFHAVFQRWRANFHGGLQIGVRVFSRQLLAGGDSVLDFLNWLGLEQDAEFAHETGVINESLDSRAALVLAIAKVSGVSYVRLARLSRALMAATAASGSSGSAFLEGPARQAIADHFRDSNRAFFAEFSPGNMPAQSDDFDLPAPRQGAGANLDTAFTRALHAALEQPAVAHWSGGLLTGRNLELITDEPSSGWRGAEDTGVWSIGANTAIRFIPPLTHAAAGPDALVLSLEGVYGQGYSQTHVSYGGVSDTLDLRSAELVIALDASVRAQGVQVTLAHDVPPAPGEVMPGEVTSGEVTPGEAAPGAHVLAYKLRSATYRFVWND